MSLHLAACDRCSYERELSSILRSYKISDETRLTIRQRYAFCQVCAQVVTAEYVPTQEELQTELNQAISVKDDARIRDIESSINWRKARVALPHCLECGSDQITYFNFDDIKDVTYVEHPGCGGLITIRPIGFSRNRLWIFYTPEGEKLETYEIFPTKGMIKRD